MSRRGNGEGSLYQRKDGMWCGAFTLGDGRRKVVYGRTRADAAQKLLRAQGEHGRGVPVVDEQVTVAAFLADWLERTKTTVKPRTHARYEQYVRVHLTPAIGRVRIAKLSPQHLHGLYAAKGDAGLSPRTIRHLHAVLHNALTRALRWGVVASNVTERVDPPRAQHREMQTLSPEQARVLLRTAEADRLEALDVLVRSTGMRQGELLRLR